MKYNKEGEFDVYELFNNEKYRARLVLGFYAILIAILIISLRTGSSSNKNVKKDNTDKEAVVNKKDDKKENENENESEENPSEENNDIIKSKFVYLLQNNYEFDYKLTMDNIVVDSKGKRTDKEILFDVISNEGTVNCYGKDDTLMCNSDGKYTETDYPAFFFNYFEPEEIMEILYESKFSNEDNKYHIDNVALYSFGDGTMDFSKVEKNEKIDNTIELVEKNGKVVGMKMDFSNLFMNDDTGLEKVQLELNYSNFGFVDDIVAPENINK